MAIKLTLFRSCLWILFSVKRLVKKRNDPSPIVRSHVHTYIKAHDIALMYVHMNTQNLHTCIHVCTCTCTYTCAYAANTIGGGEWSLCVYVCLPYIHVHVHLFIKNGTLPKRVIECQLNATGFHPNPMTSGRFTSGLYHDLKPFSSEKKAESHCPFTAFRNAIWKWPIVHLLSSPPHGTHLRTFTMDTPM